MGKVFLGLFLVLAGSVAQGQSLAAPDPFDRLHLLALVAPSYASFWGADLAGNLVPQDLALTRNLLFWTFENVEALPLWTLNPGAGAFWSGMVNLGAGASSVLDDQSGLVSPPMAPVVGAASQTLSYFGWHSAFWSTYELYKDSRFRTDDPAYFGHPFRPATVASLAAAPWDPSHLASWNTLLYSLPVAAECLLSSNGFKDAPWTTGHAFLGNREVPLAEGLVWEGLFSLGLLLPTAIGEEALFRGVEYEEWKVSFGVWPARLVEAGTFAGAHVPGDLSGGATPLGLALGFGDRALGALFFQQAYDEGGLPRAVFLHFWDDYLLSLAEYLFNSGVPASQNPGYRPLFQVSFSVEI